MNGTALTDLPASMNKLSKLGYLDLCSCNKLRSLGPELPYSLEMARVECCISLETFLDPLSQCNLQCSAICFNCFELVKRQGSKMNNFITSQIPSGSSLSFFFCLFKFNAK